MPNSSGENFSRHQPDDYVIDEMKARRSLKNDNYHKAKTKRNAFVRIINPARKDDDDAIHKLPITTTTYDGLYVNSSGKPDAVLNSVKIEQAGEYGSLVQADFQYTCFS